MAQFYSGVGPRSSLSRAQHGCPGEHFQRQDAAFLAAKMEEQKAFYSKEIDTLHGQLSDKQQQALQWKAAQQRLVTEAAALRQQLHEVHQTLATSTSQKQELELQVMAAQRELSSVSTNNRGWAVGNNAYNQGWEASVCKYNEECKAAACREAEALCLRYSRVQAACSNEYRSNEVQHTRRQDDTPAAATADTEQDQGAAMAALQQELQQARETNLTLRLESGAKLQQAEEVNEELVAEITAVEAQLQQAEIDHMSTIAANAARMQQMQESIDILRSAARNRAQPIANTVQGILPKDVGYADASTPAERAAAVVALQPIRARQARLVEMIERRFGKAGVPGCGAAALCCLFLWQKVDNIHRLNSMYRKMSLIMHPDQGGCSREQDRLKEMRELLTGLL